MCDMRSVSVPAFVLLLALPGCKGSKGTAAPGEKLDVIVMPATYAEHADASPEVVKKCKFDKDVAETIVDRTPGAKLSTGGSDLVLTMEVVSMRGVDPAWQGERSVILRGELEDGGVTQGRFRIKRSFQGGIFSGITGVCRGLDEIAEEMGDEIAAWLQEPTMDADLGE